MCLSGIAVMFGAFDAGSAPQGIATIPEICEAFPGIYLTFKGFKVAEAIPDASHETGLDPGLASGFLTIDVMLRPRPTSR